MTENTKNEITTFVNEEFGEIRTIPINGEMWFVGKDVAEALKYSDTYGALKKHVDDEDKQNCQNDSFETPRGMTVINESGLYSLIFSSKLKEAKRFKHWVTSEVLPSIRKTGGYVQHGREMEFYQKLHDDIMNELNTYRQDFPLMQKQVKFLTKRAYREPDLKNINTWKKYNSEPLMIKLAELMGMEHNEKLYGLVYARMQKDFGFYSITAIKNFRNEYFLDDSEKVSPINVIADNPLYQSEFIRTVNKMIRECQSVTTLQTTPNSVPAPLDKFDAAIRPLIELRKDKTAHGANTLGLVYDRMHSKQSWAVMRGKNKCSNKKQLIMKKDSEYDLFCKTVNEMIKEFE